MYISSCANVFYRSALKQKLHPLGSHPLIMLTPHSISMSFPPRILSDCSCPGLVLYIQLVLLSMIFSELSHVASCIWFSVLFMADMYITFAYQFIDWCLTGFHLLSLVYARALSTSMCVSAEVLSAFSDKHLEVQLWDHILFLYLPFWGPTKLKWLYHSAFLLPP